MTRSNSLWWAAAVGAALGAACGGAAPRSAGGAGAGTAAGASDTTGAAVALVPGDIVISDVTVVPMSKDGELAHRSVVVRGDRIAAVVPSAGLRVPAGVTAIDGRGKWLMPGLADMHVHVFGDDQFAMFVAAGVTTVRNMYGSDQHVVWRDKIARGELLGPTMVTAGPLIDGDPPIWPGSTVLVDPADADKVVTEQKAAGYDFLKPYSRLSKPAYEALAAAARRHGMIMAGHVPEAVGLDGVLAAGQRSIEHLDGYLAALVPDGVTLPADRMARLHAVLAKADPARLPGVVSRTLAAGTWNCATLVVLDRFGALDDVAALRKRTAWLDKIPPAIVDAWDPKQDFRLKSYGADDFAALRAGNVQRARILAALDAAGAPILVGTDTGNPFVVPGAALHDEIELMVAAGLSRPRVLRAATADAFRYLVATGAVAAPKDAPAGPGGVVEPGARADLLLVATDPLTAPLPLVPDGVILRGKWLARAELEAKLTEITGRASAPPPKDRWEGVAPLAVEGKPVHQAHYDLTSAEKPVGEERVAVGTVAGKRVIVGQEVAEFGGRFETSYRIAADGLALGQRSQFGQIEMTGKAAGGKLVATGTGPGGKPVSLSAPIPAGAFFTGPGIGGALVLAEHLGGLAPGAKRQLLAIELTTFPALAVAPLRYDVERKPDAGGHRVYAVTITQGRLSVTGDLVLDAAGFVVSHSLGAPVNLSFRRR
jgi:amidohydrolase family protein